MISTASYLPDRSLCNLSIIPGLFKTSRCKIHKTNAQNVHFYLSIPQFHQLFHLGQTPQTLTTLLASISFNNFICVDTLCT